MSDATWTTLCLLSCVLVVALLHRLGTKKGNSGEVTRTGYTPTYQDLANPDSAYHQAANAAIKQRLAYHQYQSRVAGEVLVLKYGTLRAHQEAQRLKAAHGYEWYLRLEEHLTAREDGETAEEYLERHREFYRLLHQAEEAVKIA